MMPTTISAANTNRNQEVDHLPRISATTLELVVA